MHDDPIVTSISSVICESTFFIKNLSFLYWNPLFKCFPSRKCCSDQNRRSIYWEKVYKFSIAKIALLASYDKLMISILAHKLLLYYKFLNWRKFSNIFVSAAPCWYQDVSHFPCSKKGWKDLQKKLGGSSNVKILNCDLQIRCIIV